MLDNHNPSSIWVFLITSHYGAYADMVEDDLEAVDLIQERVEIYRSLCKVFPKHADQSLQFEYDCQKMTFL